MCMYLAGYYQLLNGSAYSQTSRSGTSNCLHLESAIPEIELSEFCNNLNPLSFVKLLSSSPSADDHVASAQSVVDRMIHYQARLCGSTTTTTNKPTLDPVTIPLVYDTGASHGLTPFRQDFMDFRECRIPIKDISKMNYVTGIGTVLMKLPATNGDTVVVPGISYLLPSAEIRLFSPQTYHQRYGGSSTVTAKEALLHLPQQTDIPIRHDVSFPITPETSNVPILPDVFFADAVKFGPEFRIARHTVNFLSPESLAVDEFEYEFTQLASMLNPCVSDIANENLSSAQKELLLWHWKLGINMQRIQELMRPTQSLDRNGEKRLMPCVIVPKFPTAANCAIPRCQTCELARAKRRNPEVMRQQAIKEKEGILAADRYEPGDFVSMDQFVCHTPGRRYEGFGREGVNNRFHGGTIFNDAATGAIWVENQVSLGAGETIGAKERFEEWMFEHATVDVKHIHSDNGVFAANEFRDDCKAKNQKQTFSGVGAHHQNARAERAIQTIMYMARSFMIHVSLRWNDQHVDDICLWPFAVRHAVWLYNRLPNRITGLTPLELLHKTRADHRDLLRAHVWGCPTYVLDPNLQDGKKIPKWNRRARLGQFLGFSDEHSSLVANVRHLGTGHVSPQFHVVFDDHFHTVFGDGERNEFTDAICDLLWNSNRELYAEDEFDEDGNLIYSPPPLDNVWLNEEERRDRRTRLLEQRERRDRVIRRLRDSVPATTSPNPRRIENVPNLIETSDSDSDSDFSTDDLDPPPPPADVGSEGDADVQFESEGVVPTESPTSKPSTVSPTSSPTTTNSPTSKPTAQRKRIRWNEVNVDEKWSRDEASGRLQTEGPRRSARIKKNAAKKSALYAISLPTQPPPYALKLSQKKLKQRQRRNYHQMIGDSMIHLLRINTAIPSLEDVRNSPLAKFIKFAASDSDFTENDIDNLIVKMVHPLFLKALAAASKEDNPNWTQAMNGPFADEFWKAACKEIETLEAMGAWEVTDFIKGMNVIDSTWAFKIKRYPDGRIKKFKGRFCARGDQQIEGVDFFETYAPVVQWTTIRLMLVLEVLLDLKSKQGDVTAAFLHATMGENENVFVRMPLGFRQQGKVLKLKRTLYGLRQSPRAFWKYMVEKMEQCNMPQSEFDPCLFVGEKVICICYVDDIIFWAKDEADIHNLAMQLRDVGVDLEQEDDAAGFLGVRMERDPTTGLLEMKQEGLINRVIEAMGLDVGIISPKWTPAEGSPLVKDAEGEPSDPSFSYSSVVGMLLYLSGHSRPDIAYAVNCAARYMFNPKKSHQEALKRIGRYLKATRDRGLVINPSSNLKIDAYPDADFAGMYGYEKHDDPSCVKSRTGFVINVADCPVLWQSKLQTETALSTMEAEIVALAHSCRELFPIMDLVHSVGPSVGLQVDETTMHVSIHEDNAGALILADTLPPQHTPRSKHYHIKTIWFREAIKKRLIKLKKIETIEQLGDLFTKPLPRATFEYLRKKLMGW